MRSKRRNSEINIYINSVVVSYSYPKHPVILATLSRTNTLGPNNSHDTTTDGEKNNFKMRPKDFQEMVLAK